MFVYKVDNLLHIVPLSQIDPDKIEVLLDVAFEPERRNRTSYKIRANQQWMPSLSFAALDATGTLCGLLQCTDVGLVTQNGVVHPITFVGPLAVQPGYQRRGVGRALMGALMDAELKVLPGTDAFAVIGDPDYFDRLFGFSATWTTDWELPGPVDRHRLLAKTSRAAGLPSHAKLGPLQLPT